MPITVQYQPVEAIGQTALAAGLGQHRQRQQELLLRQQAQQQQYDLQQQQLAARLASDQQDRALNADRIMFGAQQDAARLQQQAFFQDRAQQLQFLGLQGDQQRLEFQDQQADEQRQHQIDLFQTQRDMLWHENAVKDTEDQIGTISAEIAKKSRFLTPEGRRTWMELSGDLRAIQAQRVNLRPQQYAKLLGQWQQEFQKSGIEKHINEPPPIADQWKQAAVEVAPGFFMAQQPDGKWTEVDTRASGASKLGAANTPAYMKDAAALGAELDRIKKAQPEKYQGDGVTPVAMSDEDALKVLKEREALFQKVTMPSLQQYDAAIQAFKAKAMADGTLSPEEAQHLQILQQDRAERAQLESGKAPQQRTGQDSISRADSQNYDTVSQNTRSPQQPTPDKIATPPSVKMSELGEAPKALINKFMPHPKTKADFEKLPVGTMYVAPDGSLRRK